MDPIKKVVPITSCSIHLLRSFRLPAILMGFNPLKWPLWEEHCCRDYNLSLTLVIPTDHCARSIIRGRKLIKEDQTVNCKGVPGCIFANNGLARAHSHAHAYYPCFSVRAWIRPCAQKICAWSQPCARPMLLFSVRMTLATRTQKILG